jgi:hypothetical protein
MAAPPRACVARSEQVSFLLAVILLHGGLASGPLQDQPRQPQPIGMLDYVGRHLLVAKLRSAAMEAATGAVEEVAQLRFPPAADRSTAPVRCWNR